MRWTFGGLAAAALLAAGCAGGRVAGEPPPRGPRQEARVVALPDGRRRAATFVRPGGATQNAAALLIGAPGTGLDGDARGVPTRAHLARALAEQGVASLRLDEGEAREEGGDPPAAFARTTFERLDDALEVLRRLREEPGVDPRRVGVVGHDEGALVALWAAERDLDLAFVVLLAPITLPVGAALHDRIDTPLAASGGAGEEAHRRLDAFLEAVRSGRGAEAAARRTPVAGAWADVAASPWLRVFVGLDPTPLLGRGLAPTLAVFAAEDARWPPASHASALESALDRAGRADVVVTILAGADHDFLPRDEAAPRTFVPGFAETVAGFVAATPGRSAGPDG